MGALFPPKELPVEQEEHSESDTEPTDNKASDVPMEEDENPF